MKILIYKSPGMDDMAVACRDVNEAIECFRVDCEQALQEAAPFNPEIELTMVEMSEEQFEMYQEM